MGNFKRHCTDRAASLNEFITTVNDRIPMSDEVSRLKELYSGLNDQFQRMHAKWETLAEEN